MHTQVSNSITVFQSALWQLNSIHIHYLDTTIVFDPAYLPGEIQAINEKAINALWTKRILAYTHGDFDHIVGSHWFEDFQQVGSLAMAKREGLSQILSQIETFDQENYIKRPYPISYPDLDQLLDVKDSQSIKLGSVEVIVFKAGGHTTDGLFYIIPELKVWIAGDYLSDIEFPFIEDSVKEYYDTLERAKNIVNEYDIDFLIPGHGSVAFTKSEITYRIKSSLNYLDSLDSIAVPDWRVSWGQSSFGNFLDKMHLKNITLVKKLKAN